MASVLGVTFMNGIGNFILLTAAIKILKETGDSNSIHLITDERFLQNKALAELSRGMFDEITNEYIPSRYRKVYVFPWCPPKVEGIERLTTNWVSTGLHEVQMNLEVIGASWKDYRGFMVSPHYVKIPESDKIKIVLSNCSGTPMAEKKQWHGFSELSNLLVGLGYEVYLIGIGNELENCSGYNFVNKLSITETASIIKQCDLMISTSTGNAHIADAVGTPILLIEGPILTSKNHPINVQYDIVRSYISCAPCFQKSIWEHCTHYACMDSITSANVLQKLKSFIPKMNRPVNRFKDFSERVFT